MKKLTMAVLAAAIALPLTFAQDTTKGSSTDTTTKTGKTKKHKTKKSKASKSTTTDTTTPPATK
jgi:hypothetical protein